MLEGMLEIIAKPPSIKYSPREGQVHTEAVAGLGREPRSPAPPIGLCLSAVFCLRLRAICLPHCHAYCYLPGAILNGRSSNSWLPANRYRKDVNAPRPRLLSHDRKGIKMRRRLRELLGAPWALHSAGGGQSLWELLACSAAASGLAVSKDTLSSQAWASGSASLSFPLRPHMDTAKNSKGIKASSWATLSTTG